MNVYCELSGNKYVTFSAPDLNLLSSPRHFKIIAASNRVWTQDGDAIEFVKNRFGSDMSVDVFEFMWAKLSSTSV